MIPHFFLSWEFWPTKPNRKQARNICLDNIPYNMWYFCTALDITEHFRNGRMPNWINISPRTVSKLPQNTLDQGLQWWQGRRDEELHCILHVTIYKNFVNDVHPLHSTDGEHSLMLFAVDRLHLTARQQTYQFLQRMTEFILPTLRVQWTCNWDAFVIDGWQNEFTDKKEWGCQCYNIRLIKVNQSNMATCVYTNAEMCVTCHYSW